MANRTGSWLCARNLSAKKISCHLHSNKKGRPLAALFGVRRRSCLRTPSRAAARVALHAGAIAHQREVAALAAHLALVALGLGLGAAFGGDRLGVALLPLQALQRLRRRQLLLGLGLERGGALRM